jgi:hypothetical protein
MSCVSLALVVGVEHECAASRWRECARERQKEALVKQEFSLSFFMVSWTQREPNHQQHLEFFSLSYSWLEGEDRIDVRLPRVGGQRLGRNIGALEKKLLGGISKPCLISLYHSVWEKRKLQDG